MSDNFQLGGINYHPDEELLIKLDKENQEVYDKYIEQRDKQVCKDCGGRGGKTKEKYDVWTKKKWDVWIPCEVCSKKD